MEGLAGLAPLLILVLFVVIVITKSVKMIQEGEAAVIQRFGRYHRTLYSGIAIIVPFMDQIRAKIDTRERVRSFPPQPVITKENVTVNIDVVVTFKINEPDKAIYGVDDYINGVEQITVATLRDVVGGLTLEETLTSRDAINRCLRGELDAATTKWGLHISRVELKAIDPPPSIQQSMEKQMKAEREKRAMILTAEGQREADIRTAEGEKQARILSAEGDKHASILAAEAERQAEILRAEGERAAKYLRAQGEARSIQKVNAAIKAAAITPEVLAYQYLEKLPLMAEGSANKMWVVPAQFGESLESFAKSLGKKDDDGVFRYEPKAVDEHTRQIAEAGNTEDWFNTESNPELAAAVAAANAVAQNPVDNADPAAAAAAAKESAEDATAKRLRRLSKNEPAAVEAPEDSALEATEPGSA